MFQKCVDFLDGRIYDVAEGSTKAQIFRNWTEVTCFELWKKSVAWIPFFCFYFHCLFFLGEIIFVNSFSQVSLLFCFYTTVFRLWYFVLIWFLQKIHQLIIFFLSQFHHTFITFYAFNFECNLIVLFSKRIKLYHFLLKQHLQQCSNGK